MRHIFCCAITLVAFGCSMSPKNHTQSVQKLVNPQVSSDFSMCAPSVQAILNTAEQPITSIAFKSKPMNSLCFQAVLTWLSQQSQLQSLQWSQMGLSDADLVDLLYDLDKIPLVNLDLQHNQMTDASMSALQGFVANQPTLQQLNLAENNLGDKGVCIIANGLRIRQEESSLPSLTDLNFTAVGLGPEGANCLLKQADVVPKHLTLSENNLAGWQLDYLPNGARSLETLELASIELSDETMHAIAAMMDEQQALMDLNFSDNVVSASQFQILLDAAHQHPSLQLLDVSFSVKPDFSDNIAAVLADKPTLEIKTLP